MISRSTKRKIAIGICTRQRNALLRQLLESIWEQPIPPDYDVEVIIVDNNDTPTVSPDVVDLPAKFKITVVHEKQAGLVNARNRVLDEAIDADWMIGVDDDEQVAPDWLAQFIIAFETLQADIIVAARHLVYAETTSPFIERTQQNQMSAGEESEVFSSANFALSQKVFNPKRGLGLRFHMSLNESGGEDYEFMLRAKHQHGLRAVKWPYAIVTEDFDGKRAMFRYQFRRRYLDQLTRYRIAELHRRTGLRGTWLGNAARLLKRTNRFVVLGAGDMLRGLGLLLIGREDAREIIGSGLLKWARALAIFPYLFGKSAVHYGASVNADRTASY